MMARAEAEQLGAGEPNKTEAELLDVLYEVLAQGVPAGSRLTTAEVERFLHEHARSPKSVEQMLAFFAEHSLPTNPSDYGADPELRELANGLHRERSTRSVMPLLAEPEPVAASPIGAPDESGPVRKALPATTPLDATLEDSDTVRAKLAQAAAAAAVPAKAPQRGLLFAAAAAVLLLIVGGLVLSFQRNATLAEELDRTRLQQRATHFALTELEKRAEGLRGALATSEAERSSLAGRFETFASETQQARAAEDEALKRMLGKRYEVVREQAQREAAARLSAEAQP